MPDPISLTAGLDATTMAMAHVSAAESSSERRAVYHRGSVELPILEKVDHSKFSSEKDRLAAAVNVDDAMNRTAALDFSFSFGAPVSGTTSTPDVQSVDEAAETSPKSAAQESPPQADEAVEAPEEEDEPAPAPALDKPRERIEETVQARADV